MIVSDKKGFNLLAVIGPTASGKTSLAVQLARQFQGEIISADSRQVYRGLDIGSGKDLEEYGDIPYHLIDIVDPGHEFNVFEYQQRFFDCFENILRRNKLPVLAGGSALYVDAVLRGYRMLKVDKNPQLRAKLAQQPMEQLVGYLLQLKPLQHNTTDLLDRSRVIRAIEIAEGEKAMNFKLPRIPEIKPLIFSIKWDNEVLKKRITYRLNERFQNGLIEEVQQLNETGVSWETLDFYGLEYRYIGNYLQGKYNKNDLFQKLNAAIHKFAKKQRTWLRRLERNGINIHWLGEQRPGGKVIGKNELIEHSDFFEQALEIVNA